MKRYSRKAMLQLVTMTSHKGELLYFRCPYHAKVIKTFEVISRAMGSQRDWVNSFINGREYSFAPKIALRRQRYIRRNGKCSPPALRRPCPPTTPRPYVPRCPPRRSPPLARTPAH